MRKLIIIISLGLCILCNAQALLGALDPIPYKYETVRSHNYSRSIHSGYKPSDCNLDEGTKVDKYIVYMWDKLDEGTINEEVDKHSKMVAEELSKKRYYGYCSSYGRDWDITTITRKASLNGIDSSLPVCGRIVYREEIVHRDNKIDHNWVDREGKVIKAYSKTILDRTTYESCRDHPSNVRIDFEIREIRREGYTPMYINRDTSPTNEKHIIHL